MTSHVGNRLQAGTAGVNDAQPQGYRLVMFLSVHHVYCFKYLKSKEGKVTNINFSAPAQHLDSASLIMMGEKRSVWSLWYLLHTSKCDVGSDNKSSITFGTKSKLELDSKRSRALMKSMRLNVTSDLKELPFVLRLPTFLKSLFKLSRHYMSVGSLYTSVPPVVTTEWASHSLTPTGHSVRRSTFQHWIHSNKKNFKSTKQTWQHHPNVPINQPWLSTLLLGWVSCLTFTTIHCTKSLHWAAK